MYRQTHQQLDQIQYSSGIQDFPEGESTIQGGVPTSDGSQGGAPLRTKIFLISCSFWENPVNLYVGAPPPRSWRPLLRGILYQPLPTYYFCRDSHENERIWASLLPHGSATAVAPYLGSLPFSFCVRASLHKVFSTASLDCSECCLLTFTLDCNFKISS